MTLLSVLVWHWWHTAVSVSHQLSSDIGDTLLSWQCPGKNIPCQLRPVLLLATVHRYVTVMTWFMPSSVTLINAWHHNTVPVHHSMIRPNVVPPDSNDISSFCSYILEWHALMLSLVLPNTWYVPMLSSLLTPMTHPNVRLDTHDSFQCHLYRHRPNVVFTDKLHVPTLSLETHILTYTMSSQWQWWDWGEGILFADDQLAMLMWYVAFDLILKHKVDGLRVHTLEHSVYMTCSLVGLNRPPKLFILPILYSQ